MYGEKHEICVICGIWNFPEILLDTAFTMVQNRGNYHQRKEFSRKHSKSLT